MRTHANYFFLISTALLWGAPYNNLHAQNTTTKVDGKDNAAIVARVNDVTISKHKLDEAVKAASTQLQRSGRDIPMGQMGAFRNSLLEELIALELLSQEATVRKLTPTDEELAERLSALKKMFPSEEVFHQMLTYRQMTLSELKVELRKELAIKELIDLETSKTIKITEKDIRNFYETHKEEFYRPATAKASHILIKVDNGATEEVRKAKKKKAQDLALRAKKGGPFSTLAKEHSEDTGSAPRGGNLGEFRRADMVKPFADAVFSMKPKDISDVVETEFGYHIIQLESRSPAKTLSLNEVKKDVKDYLTQEHSNKLAKELVTSLRKKATVKTYR